MVVIVLQVTDRKGGSATLEPFCQSAGTRAMI